MKIKAMKTWMSVVLITMILGNFVDLWADKDDQGAVDVRQGQSPQVMLERDFYLDTFYDDLAQMHHRMLRILNTPDSFFGDSPFVAQGARHQGFSLNIDMRQDKDYLIITCDLPGMDKDKIDIFIDQDVLTISGERKRLEETKEEGEERYIYQSFQEFGQFSRSVKIPKSIDPADTKVSYKDGVLTIKLKHKDEENKPFKVKVA